MSLQRSLVGMYAERGDLIPRCHTLIPNYKRDYLVSLIPVSCGLSWDFASIGISTDGACEIKSKRGWGRRSLRSDNQEW